MPHLRHRHLSSNIKKGLKYSPLIALLGQRQVGKTTLSTHFSKSYYSLDLRATLELIQKDPMGFLESIKEHPTVIDESQFLPELFPALKEQVRRHQKPGQFILTGSVRFSSRKKILESLTGRIIYYELLPMDLSEIEHEKLPDTLLRLSKSFNHWQPPQCPPHPIRIIDQYLKRGGLPGFFAIREISYFNQKMATQIETILERDLRLLIDIKLPFQSLKNLLTYLSMHQSEPLDLTAVSRATRISRPTLSKLIQAFTSLFLIRTIPCEGSAKKSSFMMEDQGEATYLIGHRTDPLYDLTRFLYANLRCQVHYRPELNAEFFQFRTRSGVFVPLCFRLEEGVLGIIPILEDYPNPLAIGSGQSFLKNYPRGKIIYATQGKNFAKLSPRSCIVPATSLIGI